MLDIPIGKALIAVETVRGCTGCCFILEDLALHCHCHHDVISCVNRKDGKSVIFKLVDMPYIGSPGEFSDNQPPGLRQ